MISTRELFDLILKLKQQALDELRQDTLGLHEALHDEFFEVFAGMTDEEQDEIVERLRNML